MRGIPHRPLRIALLALLLLPFGAVANAQATVTPDEGRATIGELALALEHTGYERAWCGRVYDALIAECLYDFEDASPYDTHQMREQVEAAIVAQGFDPATVAWTERPDNPDYLNAEWSVPGGTFSLTRHGTEIELFFTPSDPCIEWADTDPFDFAANSVGGSWVMAVIGTVNECVGFDHEDEFGQTPLIYAITAANSMTFPDVLRFSDPNHRTLAGWTPLMYAARLEGYLASEFVNQLLAAGADPTARAPDGTSVARLAAANPNLDADTRAALLPPPAIDPRSRRIAEDFVRQNDEVSGANHEYQREIACGLLPDRPGECFVVTRSRPLMMMLDGAMYARVGVVIIATFHDGLDLIDRYGTYRAYQLMEDAPEGRQCVRRFRVPDEANIDWTVRADGALHLHATSGPLQPHGDDRTPPRGAQDLGPLCN